jgi:hypothetical protein
MLRQTDQQLKVILSFFGSDEAASREPHPRNHSPGNNDWIADW